MRRTHAGAARLRCPVARGVPAVEGGGVSRGRWGRGIVLALALWARAMGAEGVAQDFRLPVRHDHRLRSCRGELLITADGIEYRTAHAPHARRWTFEEIRMIVLASRCEIVLHTYEAHWWTWGRDRAFRFTTMSQEIPAEMSAFLSARVRRPLATSVVAADGTPLREVAARHRHRFGGCQGTIRIYADRIVYESRDRPRDSRAWRWADILRVGRFGPYSLEIATYEPEIGGPTRVYVFDLKTDLSEEAYDFVWERVYRTAHRAGESNR